MGEVKLTKAQREALSILADSHQPLSFPKFTGKGVYGQTIWALERRGLAQFDRLANGIHFTINPAGRKALGDDNGEA